MVILQNDLENRSENPNIDSFVNVKNVVCFISIFHNIPGQKEDILFVDNIERRVLEDVDDLGHR